MTLSSLRAKTGINTIFHYLKKDQCLEHGQAKASAREGGNQQSLCGASRRAEILHVSAE
jgi:hypothetical protein